MIRNEEIEKTMNLGTIYRRFAGGRAGRTLIACIAAYGILSGSARAQCGAAARNRS
jgi:hypothetical protein